MGVDWDSWGDYQANPADHEGFGPVGYHDNPYTTGEASADSLGDSPADNPAGSRASSPSSPAGARTSSPKKSAQSGNTKEAIKLVIWGIIIVLALINVVITFAR